jgi:hypothetical protein
MFVTEMDDGVYHERCINIISKSTLEEMFQAGMLQRSDSFSDTDLDAADIAAENDDNSFADEIAHWERNEENLNQKLLDDHPKRKWMTQPLLETGHTFLKRPTASKIPSVVMHPGFYRSANLEKVENTAELASLLLPSELQSTWRLKVAAVKAELEIRQVFRSFTKDSDVCEQEVQNLLIVLVKTLSLKLGVECEPRRELSFALGGLLAKNHLVLHGRTDTVFSDDARNVILSTEVKTCKTFPLGQLWYRKTRGVQTLANLFALNGARVPVILITPKQFKLFFLVVEDGKLPKMYSFPSGMDTAPVGSGLHEGGLADVLSICLLRSAPLGVFEDEVFKSPIAHTVGGRQGRGPATEVALRERRRPEETGCGANASVVIKRLAFGGPVDKENVPEDVNAQPSAEELRVLEFPWAKVTVVSTARLGVAADEEESEGEGVET